jgi:protein-S-isoprenylcysteine O-methyltransferase Ste14
MAGFRGLFLRALLAFLALPGIVAFLVPLMVLRAPDETWRTFRPAGLLALLPGLLLLFLCVREFYVAGKGTLAPWEPPRHLVVSGPYRLSRNPMYVAVLLVLIGWAVGFWSGTLAVYAAAFVVIFHLRVILAEEPFLADIHGEAWHTYKGRVPRWFGPIRS